MKLLLVLGLTILVSPFLYAEKVQPTEQTKGCVMSFCTLEGNGMTKYFVKVADAEYEDADTGEPQIWGYDPVNKTLDKDGHIILERVMEKDFLKAGRVGKREGQPCMFHCPNW